VKASYILRDVLHQYRLIRGRKNLKQIKLLISSSSARCICTERPICSKVRKFSPTFIPLIFQLYKWLIYWIAFIKSEFREPLTWLFPWPHDIETRFTKNKIIEQGLLWAKRIRRKSDHCSAILIREAARQFSKIKNRGLDLIFANKQRASIVF